MVKFKVDRDVNESNQCVFCGNDDMEVSQVEHNLLPPIVSAKGELVSALYYCKDCKRIHVGYAYKELFE